jgi:hypothetical protein
MGPEADERIMSGKGDPVAIECASDDETMRHRVRGKLLKVVVTHSPKWGTIWRADVSVPHAPPPVPSSLRTTPGVAGPWRVICARPAGHSLTVIASATHADDMILTADFSAKCRSEHDYCESLVLNLQWQALISFPQRICPPFESALPAKDRVAAVLTWISRHPEMGSKFVSQSVQLADAELWPCRK